MILKLLDNSNLLNVLNAYSLSIFGITFLDFFLGFSNLLNQIDQSLKLVILVTGAISSGITLVFLYGKNKHNKKMQSYEELRQKDEAKIRAFQIEKLKKDNEN